MYVPLDSSLSVECQHSVFYATASIAFTATIISSFPQFIDDLFHISLTLGFSLYINGY